MESRYGKSSPSSLFIGRAGEIRSGSFLYETNAGERRPAVLNQMKSHKIQSILTFIYIFLIPFTAVLYHCLLTTPAFQKHFPMETVQTYLSFFVNLLMVLCLLSFISIIITTCNNTKKTD